jgi:molybdate transport system regulatory protein
MKKIQTKLDGRLWLSRDDKHFLGKGRIELLEGIMQTGSITKAARRMRMSYKAAWDALNEINNLFDKPIITSTSGGKKGGGTQLTKYGLDLIKIFKKIEQEHELFIQRINSGMNDFNELYKLLGRINMKTSAGNQFSVKVLNVTKGAVNSEIMLGLKGDDNLIAIITNESVKSLGIKKGIELYAIVNASQVIIIKDCEDIKISARNRLFGAIANISEGAVNSEIVIELKGGNTINAIITKSSMKDLSLKKGDKACAVFKASSVILGV